MSVALALAGIAGAHLLAAASPGPAFVVVSRMSLGQSRRAAIGAAFGVATAAVIWAAAATLGMQLLLARAAWLYRALTLGGGIYLLWLGLTMWRHAGEAPPTPLAGTAMSAARAWRTGLSTNLANPKVIVFFGSIFVAMFEPDTPTWARASALVIVGVNEAAWYCLVAVAFSAAPVRAGYARIRAWADRVTGTVMLAFGAKLAFDTRG